MGIRVLPEDEPEEAGKLDVVGLVLAAVGTVSLIYGLSDAARLGSVSTVGSGGAIALGLFMLAAFVWWSLRSDCTAAQPSPVPSPRLRGRRTRVPDQRRSHVRVHGHRAALLPGRAAAKTRPTPACCSRRPRSASPLVISAAGRVTDRYGGGRVAVIGLLIGCASLLPYTAFTEHTPYAADHRH